MSNSTLIAKRWTASAPAGEPLALREAALADRIGVSVPTLRRWRANGEGPPWTKKGGIVLYPVEKLREWLNA